MIKVECISVRSLKYMLNIDTVPSNQTERVIYGYAVSTVAITTLDQVRINIICVCSSNKTDESVVAACTCTFYDFHYAVHFRILSNENVGFCKRLLLYMMDSVTLFSQ